MKLDATLVGRIMQEKAKCPPTHKIVATKEGLLLRVPKNVVDRLFDRLTKEPK